MNLRLLPLLSLPLLAFTSCTKPPAPRGPEGIINVKLNPNPGKAIPVYVSAFDRGADGAIVKVASHKVLPDGEASFLLPLDKTYSIQCYADINLDGRRNAEDPFVKVDGVKPHPPLATGPETAPVILTLPGTGAPSPVSPSIKIGNASGTKGGGAALGTNPGMTTLPTKAAAPAPAPVVPPVPESLPVPPPPAQ